MMIKKLENKKQQNDFEKIKKKKQKKLKVSGEVNLAIIKKKKGKPIVKNVITKSNESLKLQDIIAIKGKKKKKKSRKEESELNELSKEKEIVGHLQSPPGEGKKRKRNRKRKSSEGKAETSFEVTEAKEVNFEVPKKKIFSRQEVKQSVVGDISHKSKKNKLEAAKTSADVPHFKSKKNKLEAAKTSADVPHFKSQNNKLEAAKTSADVPHFKSQNNKLEAPKSSVEVPHLNFSKRSPSESAVPGVRKRARPRNRNKAIKNEAAVVQRIVIVEKLPIRLMHTFKNLIHERFSKYGDIHHVGICEFDEETADKEFKTSIVFKDAASATRALEEDNLLWEGTRLHVFQASEAKDTTLVVRKIRDYNEAVIRSIFAPCGPIRRINSKKCLDYYTVFVEFWHRESLKEAMSIAGDIKLGGRKLIVAKYDDTKKPCPVLNLSVTSQETTTSTF